MTEDSKAKEEVTAEVTEEIENTIEPANSEAEDVAKAESKAKPAPPPDEEKKADVKKTPELIPEPKPEEVLQKTIDEIINSYFAITKTRLDPDDPTVALILSQRMYLDTQAKDVREQLNKVLSDTTNQLDAQKNEFKTSLSDIFSEATKQTDGRLLEIDKHYHQALKIVMELKTQRERLLTELSVHHQKSIIDFASDINSQLNKSFSKINWLFLATIGATLSSVASLFVLIRLIT